MPRKQIRDSLRWLVCTAQVEIQALVSRSGRSRLLLLLFIAATLAVPGTLNAATHKSHRKAKNAHAKSETRAKEEADAVAASRVAVLEVRGDNTDSIRAQVIKVLRPKVRELSTNLRAPDTAEQYRDMGAALNLALYVQGHVKDMGRDQSVLTIDLRSGVSGRKITSVRFTGNRRKLYADVEDELWTRIEKPFGRACLDATKAVRHHNAPMRIEAGTPVADNPRSSF